MLARSVSEWKVVVYSRMNNTVDEAKLVAEKLKKIVKSLLIKVKFQPEDLSLIFPNIRQFAAIEQQYPWSCLRGEEYELVK